MRASRVKSRWGERRCQRVSSAAAVLSSRLLSRPLFSPQAYLSAVKGANEPESERAKQSVSAGVAVVAAVRCDDSSRSTFEEVESCRREVVYTVDGVSPRLSKRRFCNVFSLYTKYRIKRQFENRKKQNKLN